MRTRGQHPSVLLQRNEVRGYLEACEVDRAQIHFEYGLFPDLNTEEDERNLAMSLARIDTAERLYREIVAPALELAKAKCCEALRAEGLDHYARALETEDYAHLAI
jgi:hypothetical protein